MTSLKDYRIQIKVKNNYLLTMMEREGFASVLALARSANIAAYSAYDIANLKVSGRCKSGKWRLSVLKLSEALRCLPEEIMPPQHHDNPLTVNSGEVEASIEDLEVITREWYVPIEAPDLLLEQTEMKGAIDAALKSLPERERDILMRRYGLGDSEEATLRELGEEYGISPERVRSIELRALRRLAEKRDVKAVKRYDNDVSKTDGPLAYLFDPDFWKKKDYFWS